MSETIAKKIEEQAAGGVSRVSVDGTSVDSMSIDDLIKADEYLKRKTAGSKNHLGLHFRQLEPGGCG